MRNSLLRRLGGKDPIIFMSLALLCATVLVIYLQQRALRALDRQNALITRKIAEEKAGNVLQSLRRTFDGPVYKTLASVKHPHLVERRLDLVVPKFVDGLHEYPHVERFFVWIRDDDDDGAEMVLFLDRDVIQEVGRVGIAGALRADAATGAVIRQTAHEYAKQQMIYGAYRTGAGPTESDVFLRIFYTDAARTSFFSVLGFTVNLENTRRALFPALVEGELGGILQSAGDAPGFALRIHDERGHQVYGPAGPPEPNSVERSFPLLFYPAEDILPRMAATVPGRPWRLTITPNGDAIPLVSAYTRWQSNALLGLSVLMIFIALGFALQARGRAAQLSRMQTEFVAHVSHQLKTPVSLLTAVAETLDVVRSRSPEKLNQCLDIVKTETTRLATLVQHILEFSSLSGGGRRYEVEIVSLGPLVRETVESFAAAFEATGFQIRVQEHAAPTVAVDPVAVEQAVVNLLDNAIKYSGPSRLVIVRLRVTPSHAVIEVVDHGIGIAPAEQARIFERFYRGTSASSGPSGFGLGLAIAQQLVAGQHGTIELESRLGAGSTFRILLPLLEASKHAGRQGWHPWQAKHSVAADRGVHARTEAW